MTEQEREASLLAQYALAAQRLTQPVTAETYEDMLFYLLGREGLDERPALRERVEALDVKFAEALATASDAWWRELTRMSIRTGFADAPWWRHLLREAVMRHDATLPQAA
jgi:hypothetical protein